MSLYNGFCSVHRLDTFSHLVEHDKYCHKKVLFGSFQLHGHTSGFHPDLLNSYNHLVPHYIHVQNHMKVLLSSFHWSDHSLGFNPQTQNLKHFLQHNKQYSKQYCLKVLLSSFHLNGHTCGFYPPDSKVRNLE